MTQINLTYEQYLPTKVLFGVGQLNNWCITKPYNKECDRRSNFPIRKLLFRETAPAETQSST